MRLLNEHLLTKQDLGLHYYDFIVDLLAAHKDPTSGIKIDNKTLNKAIVLWLNHRHLDGWKLNGDFLRDLPAEKSEVVSYTNQEEHKDTAVTNILTQSNNSLELN